VRSLSTLDDSLGVFDTILLLRNNFGLVDKEGCAARLLRWLAAITTARGRLIPLDRNSDAPSRST
jgi:hypothetical protein